MPTKPKKKMRTAEIHLVNRIIYRRSLQKSEKDAEKGKDPAIEIPEVWEPFAVTPGEGVDVVWIRQIVKREVAE